LTRRLCIFAHFDAAGGVAPYVLYHLERLREACSRLVFASNSAISGPPRHAVEDRADRVLERPNTGFDFAAWRDALAGEDMGAWDAVLLVNSSMIGPLRPLGPVLDEMDARPCDFWGFTRHDEIAPHLQSYFLCFRTPVVQSAAWREFWARVRDEMDKKALIRDCEAGLTGYFEDRGFVSDSFVTPMRFEGAGRYVWQRRASFLPKWRKIDRNHADLTMFAAPELIAAGMPYFKASLVWGSKGRRRPRDIARIKALPDIDYDWSLLDRR
jgi:rhamnosyltransferase